MSRLRAALALSWRDWWILLQAWLLLLAADLGLRVLPLQRIQRYVALASNDARSVSGSEASGVIERMRWLVGIAGRYHLHPMRCLQRALVLQWLLGRCGIGTELRIGVRRQEDGLRAHAWLEHAGQPIGEPQSIETRFAPLVACDAGR